MFNYNNIKNFRSIKYFVVFCLLFVFTFTSCKNNEKEKNTEVKLVTHSSFAISDFAKKEFTKKTGYKLKIIDAGDDLANKIALSANSPLGDIFFGVDNTFLSRIVKSGAVEGKIDEKDSENSDNIKPVDFGDVTINADKVWFKKHNKTIPKTFDDLALKKYKNLLVAINPATSTPGLSFLLSTIGNFGENNYFNYWKKLKNNGIKIASSWDNAYYSDFTGASKNGKYPLVVSYSSSPAFTLYDNKTKTKTISLSKTSFRQTEYAGVLKGAKNIDGAKKLLEFFLSNTFQKDIPEKMYMYPINENTTLPKVWKKFANVNNNFVNIISSEQIDKNREKWISDWTENILS